MKPVFFLPQPDVDSHFWRVRMESGQKTCMICYVTKGIPGQCFRYFDRLYVILWIQERSLREVAEYLFLQEGCNSPEEFKEAWVRLHPKTPWVPTKRVIAHHFMRLDEWQRRYVKKA